MVLFNMIIGDTTGEGHRLSQSFQVECLGGSLREARNAHYESIKAHRININKVCNDDGDKFIKDEWKQYAEDLVNEYLPNELNTISEGRLTPSDMALLWAAIIMDTNKNLTLRFIDTDEEITRTFNTIGFDDMGRHMEYVGFETFD